MDDKQRKEFEARAKEEYLIRKEVEKKVDYEEHLSKFKSSLNPTPKPEGGDLSVGCQVIIFFALFIPAFLLLFPLVFGDNKLNIFRIFEWLFSNN